MNMTPEESLALISGIVKEAKERQQERGTVYLYWGGVLAMVGLAHYILIQQEMYTMSFLPYLTIPVAAGVSYWLFGRNYRRRNQNVIGATLNILWLIMVANLMFIGFALPGVLQDHLTPTLLVLHGIAIAVSGAATQNPILLWGGVIGNLIGLGCYWVDWTFHPLFLTLESIISSVIPGIVLNFEYRQRRNA